MIRRIRAETEQEIQQLEKSISRSQEVIGRLRSQKNNQNVISRYEKDIQNFTEKMNQLQTILNEIDMGVYEEKLKTELENNRKMIETKSKSTQKKKQDKLNQQIMQSVQKPTKNNQESNPNYVRHINMDREEHFYLKDCRSLPNHLQQKLKNMTNDTGFIWKDIWCLGELPSKNRDHYPLTLHEKKDSKMLVHIYDRHKYSLYEKDANGRRHLLMTRAR
jgi:tRNA U34 5-carboxymethylaminomethyl modifying GTPase MnmE/TrmE